MKGLSTLLVFVLLVYSGYCQKDSSVNVARNYHADVESDSDKVGDLWYEGQIHLANAPDSALIYAQEGLVLARQIKYAKGEGLCLLTIAKVFMYIGSYSKALEISFQSLKVFELLGSPLHLSICLNSIAEVFSREGEYRQALFYNFRAISLIDTATSKNIDNKRSLIKTFRDIGYDYEQLNQLDSALFFADESFALCAHDDAPHLIGKSANLVGDIYAKSGKLRLAMNFYRRSISYSEAIKDNLTISEVYLGIAGVYNKEIATDSCLYYSKLALAIAKAAGFRLQMLNTSNFLTEYYRDKKTFDSAYAYQQLSIKTKDSLFSSQKIMEFENISFSEKVRQEEIKEAEVRYRNKVGNYILFGTVAVFLFVAIVLWRNNRQKQRANILLNKQKAEIEFQKTKAEKALEELQSTQTQLVQAEKMASLGELTAGIAHEIQNPLNFVNNFSEINEELIGEMKEEIEKGNFEEAKTIATNIAENEHKINIQGKRADAIVKGMLQHSRTSTGQKEPTDINALADEFLRLSYHGLRAKDKTFNAVYKTDFDADINKINIVPQDMGRVLLNLYNNAFYAVSEKKKQGPESYEPTVTVSTKKTNDKIEIKVRDNGNGIPQRVLDKIYQPFFTTKPTGLGTGLGLSISYDIVKTHRGELKVNTREGEYAEFIISLPV